MKKILPLLFPVIVVLFFFRQVFLQGFLPIPSDTIVGLYYPFRSIYINTNPNGVPFKNFLITDPVRQQYPWKKLSIDISKKFDIPSWNPYNFSGSPLLANFQSGSFYPLNFLFLFLSFETAWTLFIVIQPLLSGIFTYLYLRNLKLREIPSSLGAIVFSFCGFSVVWLEWGNILHTALWLPLILLSIDKIVDSIINQKISLKDKKITFWSILFITSLIFSFFAGHLQTFFYLFVFSFFYFFARWWQYGKNKKTLFFLACCYLIFFAITSIQWIPTLKYIFLSARNIDLIPFDTPGWFIPWQNIVQFIAPDFFGNPATLNYWGEWNYAEFSGYIGIAPLIFALFAVFFRRDKKTFLFGLSFFLSLIFAFPTFFAKIPFLLNIPFISSAQPTRLLFITDFSLSVLAALGLDYFIASKNKKGILYILGALCLLIAGVWFFILFLQKEIVSIENILVSRQNFILPSFLFCISAFLIIACMILSSRKLLSEKIIKLLFCLIILISAFDLIRFGWKFTPFTKKDYLFPNTDVTSFLQKQKQPFRVMSVDERILPPNFLSIYKIQSIEGYDPLYLKRYGELIAAVNRGEPNIKTPFGFNRIITSKNYSSKIIDLLNVRYILSLDEIKDPKLELVFSDGQTKIYENTNVGDRAFFAEEILSAGTKQEAINMMFDEKTDLRKKAIVENLDDKNLVNLNLNNGAIEVVKYSENKIIIKTNSKGESFLVLTDSFYPTWKAKIDDKLVKIFLTDFNFRGIFVPTGKHTIEFYNTLF